MLGSQASHSEQLNLRHYDTRDGIPQIQVSSVGQDATGYLWIGTYGGLARYNGNDFTVFRGERGLSTSYINTVEPAGGGSVWVGTARGLCRWFEDAFECFNPDGLPDLMVNAVLVDSDHIWVGAEEGLFRLAEGRFEALGPPAGASTLDFVNALARDRTGRVWIASDAGLFRLEDDRPARFKLPYENIPAHALQFHGERLWVGAGGRLFAVDAVTEAVEEYALPLPADTRVRAIVFDLDERLWLASPEGLLRGTAGDLELLTAGDGLPNKRIIDLAVDREGLVWAATDQGLVKILPGPFEGYSVSSGLLASFVRTINEDAQGRLWLGTREGLQIIPSQAGRLRMLRARTLQRADGLPDNRVYSIAFDGSSAAWIATARGVVRWDENAGVTERIGLADGLPAEEVHALLLDRSGRLWISSTRGTRFLADGEIESPVHPELAGAFALRIRQDAAGRLWFSTLRHGLIVLEPDGSLEQYRKDQGLTDEMLWDLAPSADGSMWVGSNGDGLFRVWPDGRIRQITSADGLADDSVWQVLEDDAGRVWAYTNQGLSRIDETEITNYTERDGLLHLEGGATGALQTSDGLLWFASADGLMRYDSSREYTNMAPPPVVVESVELEGAAVDHEQRLPHRPGNLVIHFAGLSFQDESAVRYRYRLLGASERWSEPTDNHQVTFANLGHGDYRFEVRAANPDGVWSRQPAAFAFSVATPFWARPSSLVLAVFALAVLVSLAFHLRLRRAEAVRRRLQHLVDRRTAELSDANRRLQRTARTDQLTGLPNRRYLFDRIGEDLARSRRAHFDEGASNADIAFLMIDLDDFKPINDAHGHDVGDRVLAEFSAVLSEHLRESDFVVRWGGEEFLVVACETEAAWAHQLAGRLVDAVRGHRFTAGDDGPLLELTCSVGIACYPFGQPPDALDWEQVVQLADAAVYQAKSRGRDCWVQFEPGADFDAGKPEEFLREVKQAPALAERKGLIRWRFGDSELAEIK